MNNPIPFDEAVRIAAALVQPMGTESIAVDLAVGRILAETAVSRVDNPPFARVMMDGYAIQTADISSQRKLRVVGVVAAGDMPPRAVGSGEAMRVMTGCPLPAGADTVVRQEWCDVSTPGWVSLLRLPLRGESVQAQGADTPAGAPVLPAGVRITPAHVALLRACGLPELLVYQRASASVFVTGSELTVDPAQPLPPAHIYAANDSFLSGGFTRDGLTVRRRGQLADDPDRLRDAIVTAAAESDVVVLTGGVSAGDFDFLPQVLSQLAGGLAVQRVAVRPGSPFLACRIGRASVFALSGNPAAAFAQFETIVRPLLRAAQGQADSPFPLTAQLTHRLDITPIRPTRILRAVAQVNGGRLQVDARMAQSAGALSSFGIANCLVRIDGEGPEAGAIVQLRLLDDADLRPDAPAAVQSFNTSLREK